VPATWYTNSNGHGD